MAIGTRDSGPLGATAEEQLALRSRIVLACGQGQTNSEVLRQLRVSMPTVGKWRKRFPARRLDGLLDEPRPGAPRTIGDAQVEAVITRTLESRPAQATHWSTAAWPKPRG